MSDVERWLVEKVNIKGGDGSEGASKVNESSWRGLSTKCEMNSSKRKAVSTRWDARWRSLRPHPVCYPPRQRVLRRKRCPLALRLIHPSRSTHRRIPTTYSFLHHLHRKPTITSAVRNGRLHISLRPRIRRLPACALPATSSLCSCWSAASADGRHLGCCNSPHMQDHRVLA